MPVLVSRKAPDFCADAVLAKGELMSGFRLSEAIKGKYGLLFFYPLDFTFVCPTEIIALAHRYEQFKKRNVEVIAVSIDSKFTHYAWQQTPVNKGGIGEVPFTMVADINHSICQSYGVEHPEAAVAFRASFIIDKQGYVKAQLVNDLPIGRNIDELLRVVDAMIYHEQHGEVCPAGWQAGDAAMTATTAGVASYLAEHESKL